MLQIFKNLFKKPSEIRLQDILDPMIGRKVICFATHGCQAEIHKFQWVGVITGTHIQPSQHKSNRFMQYVVKVLKEDRCGEARDRALDTEYIHPSELQNLGDNLMIVYK